MPNYPHSPHPHVYTFFNDDKHMQCFNPHSTYMILSFNYIFYGCTLLDVSSNPNYPCSLDPILNITPDSLNNTVNPPPHDNE